MYNDIFIISDFVSIKEKEEEEEEEPEQNYICESKELKYITYGNVPINMHNLGIFIREFYDSNINYFDIISQNHEFQNLTESNKPSKAYRTGIYITPVTQTNMGTKYNLLRCSSNFTGGTDNTTDIDKEIIEKTQILSDHFFTSKANLNHVLAQIYWNTQDNTQDNIQEQTIFKNQTGDKKAIIKAHSDKTKDMPKNAVMAFVSFYKDFSHLKNLGVHKNKKDIFDYVYGNSTVLTKLRFVMKKETENLEQYKTYPKNFDITLYPNSLFLMSLTTNRLYTHEIVPSNLPVKLLPVRMGYVIRCSKTEAINIDDYNYMVYNDTFVKMVELTKEERELLKKLYAEENCTINKVEYPYIFASMNAGDYLKPKII
jgi:hypothetical protein